MFTKTKLQGRWRKKFSNQESSFRAEERKLAILSREGGTNFAG